MPNDPLTVEQVLMPCPFCGEQPDRINIGNITEAVCCRGPRCDAKPSVWAGGGSVASWNTRLATRTTDEARTAKGVEAEVETYRQMHDIAVNDLGYASILEALEATPIATTIRKGGE